LERAGDMSKGHARFGALGEETKGYVRLDEYDEEDYLGGKYNAGAASKETRELYFEIKRRILENFEDLEPRQKKVYTGFYSKTNGACICTLAIRKSKMRLKYSVIASRDVLSPSEFIREVESGGFGVGEYQSDIKDEKDIEQALPHIQKVYDYKMKN